MDQLDLFGHAHTIHVPAPHELCTTRPNIAFAVLEAVFNDLVDIDGRHTHDQFIPDHLIALAHLQAEQFVQPGKGPKRGMFVLTPRGRDTYLRWRALTPLREPGEVRADD